MMEGNITMASTGDPGGTARSHPGSTTENHTQSSKKKEVTNNKHTDLIMYSSLLTIHSSVHHMHTHT